MTKREPLYDSHGQVAAASYAVSGVDVAAAELAVELMRESVASTSRREVIGSLGGFAGLFDASVLKRFDRPVLATSTDGVGTKVSIASQLGRHDTIGLDLVAMVVDDLVVCGAEPLFMTDYIACGRVVPERIAAIVSGIAQGSRIAGCALIGGETAEHPGLLEPDDYDLAAAATGVVEAANMLGPDRVRSGDVLIGMASSGLHSNGYSLARHVFLSRARWDLERFVPELGRPLGDELLEPTRIYALDCLELAGASDAGLRALAHVTGGGIAANLARVMPPGLTAIVDRSTWSPPAVFRLVGDVGGVSQVELERTLNMGIGMVAVVAPDSTAAALTLLGERGVEVAIIGYVRSRSVGDASDSPAKGGQGGIAHLSGEFPR